MKTRILAIILGMTFSLAATAGTVYRDRDHTTALIDPTVMPRLRLWPNGSSAITNEGEILVCNFPRTYTTPEGHCLDPKGNNAWQRLTEVKIPGMVMKAYEIRSNGTLLVYYGPQDVKK